MSISSVRSDNNAERGVGIVYASSNEHKAVVCAPEKEEEKTDVELHEYNQEWAKKSKANLKELRRTRNDKDVSDSLKALEKAAKGTDNVMPYLVKCCHAYATVGEMAGVFRQTFGEWNEPDFY